VAQISEQLMIADVERRLTSKYAHLPPDQISAAVQDAREIRAEPDSGLCSASSRAARPR
jgi:hypothetical protein